MTMKIKQLKVKLKHISTEPAIIRLEEKKALKRKQYSTHQNLYLHRINIVRNESRATNLAYAYIRGKKYSQVENTEPLASIGKPGSKLDTWTRRILLRRVADMIYKYGEYNFSPDELKKVQECHHSKHKETVREIISKNILNDWILNNEASANTCIPRKRAVQFA